MLLFFDFMNRTIPSITQALGINKAILVGKDIMICRKFVFNLNLIHANTNISALKNKLPSIIIKIPSSFLLICFITSLIYLRYCQSPTFNVIPSKSPYFSYIFHHFTAMHILCQHNYTIIIYFISYLFLLFLLKYKKLKVPYLLAC